MVSSLRSFPGGLRYAELCGGIGAPTFAIKALGIPAQLIGHWDTEDRYKTFLHKFIGDHEHVFLGEQGNVFTMDSTMLATCHCIVSGPPCPPWSNIGLQAGNADIRADVFWTVCDHIINAARNGVVMFFVLENVPSLDHWRSGQTSSETPAMKIEAYLQDRLGSGWVLEQTVMNTLDFGLPQRRKRLYITGRRMASYPLGPPDPCALFKQVGRSSDILDKSNKDMPSRVFTATQSRNIKDHKTLHRSVMPGQGRVC
jgi:DNA (cytosine-5)-methyltransferase 1